MCRLRRHFYLTRLQQSYALGSNTEVCTESFLRLVDAHESPLVRDVFADQILSRIVGVPPSIRDEYDYRLCVPPTKLGLPSAAFGDADAVLIERGRPQRASAVEFKRVKVTQASLLTEEINKLGELPKAVRQANSLYDAGFGAVWLTVIVVADMRSADGNAFRFTPGKLVQKVKDALPLNRLNPAVGVTVCEITQTSDRPANWRGGSGGQILQMAAEREQPANLTSGIAGLFS